MRFRSGRWQPALVVDAWAHNACRDGHIASASSRGASAGAGAAEGATCSLDVAEDVAKIEEPVVNARSLKKIIPLGIIFFFCLFNYTILRDTKDVLVVTAPNSGAEAIPFLKTWVNLPFAIACMLLYTRAGATLGSEALFYASVTPFLAFFFLFAFAIYPNASTLHPIDWADWLITKAGPAFKGPIGIVRNWTYALFYVMAEMWGSVVVSLGFWSFANQITSVREAKVFYPLFGLGANVSLVISGYAVKYFSQIRANLPPGADPWDVSLKALMSLVALGGVIMLATNWYMYRCDE